MNTITRERLLTIQQWRETYGPGSNVVLPAEEAEELARSALASLEAEPVGEVSEQRDGLVMDGTVDLGGASTHRIIKGASKMKRLPLGTKFYTAPPAPVVPEEMPKGLAGQIVSLLAHNIGDKFLAQKIWNACRDAMLQGAEPVTTAYKLPPHIYRELVNRLRDTAVKYQGCQQLREQLSRTLQEVIQPAAPQQEEKAKPKK
ncbi:hypothetical protein [Enterobacter cloacae]|uniref:hypothetical protein n=1 Tax=Enterobacter cloacae TaxID=550 RepID=UPI0021A58216